jgi:hypothetical protein
MEWDFADSAKRHLVADDLIASLRKGAFPHFAIFEGLPEDIAAISLQDWPRPEGILSYLLSIGRVSLANEMLQAYLNKTPKVRHDCEQLYRLFLEQGPPPYRAAHHAEGLAAFAVAAGLTLNVS